MVTPEIPPIIESKEQRTKRVNVAIKDDLHREVKIRAAETRKTVTEFVEAALRRYLKEGRR